MQAIAASRRKRLSSATQARKTARRGQTRAHDTASVPEIATTTATKKASFQARQRRALQRSAPESLKAFAAPRPPSLPRSVPRSTVGTATKKRVRAAVPLRDARPPLAAAAAAAAAPADPIIVHLARAATQAATAVKAPPPLPLPLPPNRSVGALAKIDRRPRKRTRRESRGSGGGDEDSQVHAWKGNIVDNSTALESIDAAFRTGGSLLVLGPPGVGKTMALRQASRYYGIHRVREVSVAMVGGVVAIAKEIEELVVTKNMPGERMVILVDGLEQLANKDSQFGATKKFGREATLRAPNTILRAVRSLRRSRNPQEKLLVFVCQTLPPGWKGLRTGDSAVQHVARFYTLRESHMHAVLDRLLRHGDRSARLSAAYKRVTAPLGRNAGVVASRFKKGLVLEAHGDARHLVHHTRLLFSDRARDPQDEHETLLTPAQRDRRDAAFAEVIARLAGFDLRLPEAHPPEPKAASASAGGASTGGLLTQANKTFPEATGGIWSAARVLAGGSSKLSSPDDVAALLQAANVQDTYGISKLGQLLAGQLADRATPIVSKSTAALATLRRLQPSRAAVVIDTQVQALRELAAATDDLSSMDLACAAMQPRTAGVMLGSAALRRSRSCFDLDGASHGSLRKTPDLWRAAANYKTCQDRAVASYRSAHRRLCAERPEQAVNADGAYVGPLSLLGGWSCVDISSIPNMLACKIPQLPPFEPADQARAMQEAATGHAPEEE